jgi:hypothetical protein
VDWNDPRAFRVLVVAEPELFRSALALALSASPGVAARPEDPQRYRGPAMSRLLHPSNTADVVVASADIAARLSLTGLPVVEVPAATAPALVLYTHGVAAERRAATLSSLIRLVQEATAETAREPTAEAR